MTITLTPTIATKTRTPVSNTLVRRVRSYEAKAMDYAIATLANSSTWSSICSGSPRNRMVLFSIIGKIASEMEATFGTAGYFSFGEVLTTIMPLTDPTGALAGIFVGGITLNWSNVP
jgi:hypothetical protein